MREKFQMFSRLALFICLLGLQMQCSHRKDSSWETAPTISSEPQSQTVTAPASATFTVEASGNPTPTYQWNLGGQPVSGANGKSYTTPATTPGIYTYTCTVANAAGTVTSHGAILTVNPPDTTPPTITSFVATPGTIQPGQSGILSWSVKGAVSLKIDQQVGTVTGTEIKVTPTISTVYTLTATSLAGIITTASTVLYVTPTGFPYSIYVGGGNQDSISKLSIPGYWSNGAFNALSLPSGANSGMVSGLAVVGDQIYASYFDRSTGGYVAPGYWLNGTWVSLEVPTDMLGGNIFSLIVSGSDVYAGGGTYKGRLGARPTTAIYPAYWLNGKCNSLPMPFRGLDGFVESMVMSGSQILAGGWFSTYYYYNTAVYESPVYWIGGTSYPLLPRGDQEFDTYPSGELHSLAVSGSDVYAGGAASGRPGYWLKASWIELTMPADAVGGSVKSIAVSGGDVYAAGYVKTATQVRIPGYWLNGRWIELTIPTIAVKGRVESLILTGRDVLAAGVILTSAQVAAQGYMDGSTFVSTATAGIPGYWLNGSWVSLPQPPGSPAGEVYTLVIQ